MIKVFDNGTSVTMTPPSFPSGMITVTLYGPDMEVFDRVRCDTKSQAREYFRVFCKIAKGY